MISNQDLYNFSQQKLKEINEHQVAECFSIHWNPRMRSTAGRAKLQLYEVEMNPKLIPFGEHVVWTTVLHELAHLIAWNRCRHRGHGVEWQEACADLGIPNTPVTHDLPLPRRQQTKRWRYRCPNCNEYFDRVRQAKRAIACAICCKAHNDGKYSYKYKLKESDLKYD